MTLNGHYIFDDIGLLLNVDETEEAIDIFDNYKTLKVIKSKRPKSTIFGTSFY